MKIHHLNCGIMQGLRVGGEYLVCHCLLVETERSGLVLVDAGLGFQDLINPVPRLGRAFTWVYARPERDTRLAAVAQVKRMGFDPKDVRHIILTHMDLDHVGGLVDFPDARVHVHAAEYASATNRRSALSLQRYMAPMWAHQPHFVTYAEGGEPWLGFDAIRQLKGLPPEILLVPTMGHTRGHTAVAVAADGGWMVHAGDAYFDHREVHADQRACSALLEAFQFINQTDRQLRLYNQERLRRLAQAHPEVTVFCAHNPLEYAMFAQEP